MIATIAVELSHGIGSTLVRNHSHTVQNRTAVVNEGPNATGWIYTYYCQVWYHVDLDDDEVDQIAMAGMKCMPGYARCALWLVEHPCVVAMT